MWVWERKAEDEDEMRTTMGLRLRINTKMKTGDNEELG